MKLTPPKKTTFWISVILAVAGVVVFVLPYIGLAGIAWLGIVAFVLVVLAFLMLVLGLLVKGF